MARSKNHYVNNKQFLESLIQYRAACKQAADQQVDTPPVPKYIGECLLQIATRLSHKPNFANYQFREDMISDGLENCINYIHNFDPEKSQNPFAYFTQIIYYAFLRRIQKEKKQLYVKHKALENSYLMDAIQEEFHGSQLKSTIDNTSDYMHDFVENFESKLEKRKVNRRKGIELYYNEDK